MSRRPARTLAVLLLAAVAAGTSACTDPYSPGQRAVGGGLLGAAGGAAIGGLAGGGSGAAAGALLGGAGGAVVGAATTPTPPAQAYYGAAPAPGYYAAPAAPAGYYRY